MKSLILEKNNGILNFLIVKIFGLNLSNTHKSKKKSKIVELF
jgi:hypothetical protein